MAYLDYGTVIKKNDIIISEDSWTEQELKINDNFVLGFRKCTVEFKYNGIEKTERFLDDSSDFKYAFKIKIDDIIFKVKRLKCHDQQFLLTFNYGKDSYKILFGYGVGCDWVDKKTRKYFNRLVNRKLSERSAIEWNRIMLDYIEDNNVGK